MGKHEHQKQLQESRKHRKEFKIQKGQGQVKKRTILGIQSIRMTSASLQTYLASKTK